MAYERLYGPLGPARSDYQAAMIASTIAAVNTDPKKNPPKLTDFLIDWEEAGRGDDP